MEYSFGPLTTVSKLEPGTVFETNDGIRAVKSEYYNGDAIMCILLASGEYAYFKRGNDEPCRAILWHDTTAEDD